MLRNIIETRELNFAPKFKQAITKLQLTLQRLNKLARYVYTTKCMIIILQSCF